MIELLIYQYNVSGQVVKSFNVDLFDDVPLPVVKSIVDIKEPEKRNSDYTLSITIPATANNRKIFSEIDNLARTTINTSNLNYNPDFNPNFKSDAIVLKNGVEQMRGYLQLTEVPLVGNEVNYEVVIIGKLANLFQDIGESLLTNLDLSAYEHAWNYLNVANSWANYIIKNGGTYNNFDVSGNPNGEGYVYPLIDNGTSQGSAELVYDFEKTMYPSIYVKQIVDTIFQTYGYRYESEFFNSIPFKKLIVPFTSGNFIMTSTEVSDRTFIVDNNADLVYNTTGTSAISPIFKYDFNNITKDTVPSGVDEPNNLVQIAAGNGGLYKLGINGQIKCKNVSGFTLPGTANVGLVIDITRIRNGVRTIWNVNTNYAMAGTAANTEITTSVNFTTPEIDLQVNDEIYVEFAWYGIIAANWFEFTFLNGFKFTNTPSSKYSYGQTVSLNAALPSEVKQSDFLIWVFRMFNLYAVADKIDPKKLIIEPRDNFYTNEIVDITNYLDTSREMIIEPMGVLDFRRFEMAYKEDKDEYNTKYQNLYRETYGTKRIEVNNDFLRETQKVDVGFSASPLANASTHDRIYTKIRQEDPPTQSTNTPAYNIRILFYGGLVNTSTGWTLKYDNGTLTANQIDFPYCGMLDSTSNPQYDLGWSMPKAINYGLNNTLFTNGNLYNRYWRKTIEEITDKDSKLITCYFKFSENQFYNLNFRKYYLIDRQYYRLYQIEHDVTSNEPVKIQFLKLKVAPEFVLESSSGNGGSGEVLDSEDLPAFESSDNSRYFNNVDKSKVVIKSSTLEQTFIEYKTQVQFLEGVDKAYLPDADEPIPDTGAVIIKVKNIDPTSVKIYTINENQLVNGSSYITINYGDSYEFVNYNGNWQIIGISSTGGA